MRVLFDTNILIAAAEVQAGAEIVVTRNPDDFRDGPLTAYHPEEVLEILG